MEPTLAVRYWLGQSVTSEPVYWRRTQRYWSGVVISVGEGVIVDVCVWVGDPEGVGVTVTVLVGDPEGVGDPLEGVGVSVAVGVAVTVAVAVTVGVAVAVGMGEDGAIGM
jgi:hypothetical protein